MAQPINKHCAYGTVRGTLPKLYYCATFIKPRVLHFSAFHLVVYMHVQPMHDFTLKYKCKTAACVLALLIVTSGFL